MDGMSEYRIGRRNAELSKKLDYAILPVLFLHGFDHRPRFRHVSADAKGMIVGKPPQISEQLRRSVDRRSIGSRHKLQTVSILVLTQKVLDLSKCLLRFFLRAIWHDLTRIHDRPCEHSSQTRILDRPNRFEGTVGAGVQKIVLANRCHSAANRLDASEQASSVKMLGPEHARTAIDPPEPRH